MRAHPALSAGALLALLAAGAWVTAHSARRASQDDAADVPATPSTAALDSATVMLHGRLTPPVRALLGRPEEGPSILVLLDSADVRVCEDLGRQLRELSRRVTVPVFIVGDPQGMVRIRAFARRERLRPAAFIPASPGEVVEGRRIPTPAALVHHPDGWVAGVGHPRRFRNVRTRSFADELSAYLPSGSGNKSPPESGRVP